MPFYLHKTMKKTKIGFLHPGAMGISLAVSAQKSGFEACWISDGRSPETRMRTKEHGLTDLDTLAHLTQTCSALVSICPPHAALDVAKSIAALSYTGLYIDANAIAPQTAQHIQFTVEQGGARFVDGGVIGGPAWESGSTWLHLSGKDAEEAASFFASGALETNILSEEIGQASALKMAFAAYSKGTTALLAAILTTAEHFNVRTALEEQWEKHDPEFVEQAHNRTRRVTAKAWRFAGEMDEIAATFADTGLPNGFHEAAGDIYRRMADFKDAEEKPSLEEVLKKLLANE